MTLRRKNMIFAAILAGGAGNRMGEVDKPKQFLKLGDKPIIIQTVEKFSLNSKIDQIIVLCQLLMQLIILKRIMK